MWRRNLFVWETEQVQNLMLMLHQVTLDKTKNDEWLWESDSSGVFSTKSAYMFLDYQERANQIQEESDDAVFKQLWKCSVPSKVLVFTCQSLLGKIPTKNNLQNRGFGFSLEEQCCVLYR